MEEEKEYCQWKKCKEKSYLIYLGKGVCEKHWGLIDKLDNEIFRKKLGIRKNKNAETMEENTDDAEKNNKND